MRARLLTAVVLVLACAGQAGAVTPPKGIPDLAKMGLRATDFPGSRVAHQGYVAADDPFIASYEREFAPGSVRIGTKRMLVESDVDLARSAAVAHSFMVILPAALALLDPNDLAESFASGSGQKPKYVKISKLRKIAAGDEAGLVTFRIGTTAGELRLFLVFMRVDRVLNTLVGGALPKVVIGIVEATRMSKLAAAHDREALVPANTTLPAVSGQPTVGQTLTATPGTWTNAPTSFDYLWQRCDVVGTACVLTGGTAQTYTLMPADAGSTIRVAVTAHNAYGTGQASSTPTLPIAGPPVNTVPPAIAGTATVGQVLTASPGSWAGSPAFAYQWQRCDAAGANCVPIDGATVSSYTIDAADAGSTLRVAVTGTNALGSATAVSPQTTVVT